MAENQQSVTTSVQIVLPQHCNGYEHPRLFGGQISGMDRRNRRGRGAEVHAHQRNHVYAWTTCRSWRRRT